MPEKKTKKRKKNQTKNTGVTRYLWYESVSINLNCVIRHHVRYWVNLLKKNERNTAVFYSLCANVQFVTSLVITSCFFFFSSLEVTTLDEVVDEMEE